MARPHRGLAECAPGSGPFRAFRRQRVYLCFCRAAAALRTCYGVGSLISGALCARPSWPGFAAILISGPSLWTTRPAAGSRRQRLCRPADLPLLGNQWRTDSASCLAGAALVGPRRGVHCAQRHGRRAPHYARAVARLAAALSPFFSRTFGSFFVAGLAGVFAFALCLFLWRLLPAHQIWVACLLAQLGLFLLLAGRFWQRGIEATLVMAADPPRIARTRLSPTKWRSLRRKLLHRQLRILPGLSEPTLRELVLKLSTEPLGQTGYPFRAAPIFGPGPVQAPPKPAEVSDSTVSRLDRHETKFPLGGVTPEKEPDPTEPGDASIAPENPDKTPHSEKKPLP